MLPRKPCRIEPPKPPLNRPSMARIVALSRLMCNCNEYGINDETLVDHSPCVVAGYYTPLVERNIAEQNNSIWFDDISDEKIETLREEGLIILLTEYSPLSLRSLKNDRQEITFLESKVEEEYNESR